MPYRNYTVQEIKAKLDAGESFRLIDVREPREHEIVHIEGAELLPLSRNPEWIESIPHDTEVVFFCHHGGRSAQVASYLANKGHTNVANMLGGIDTWAEQLAPDMPRYE